MLGGFAVEVEPVEVEEPDEGSVPALIVTLPPLGSVEPEDVEPDEPDEVLPDAPEPELVEPLLEPDGGTMEPLLEPDAPLPGAAEGCGLEVTTGATGLTGGFTAGLLIGGLMPEP